MWALTNLGFASLGLAAIAAHHTNIQLLPSTARGGNAASLLLPLSGAKTFVLGW